MQVGLGIHGHVPAFGFHISLVGDAAGIGGQFHTLAARHGPFVLQVGLGVHGHVTVFGFHIAVIGDAAGNGSHDHSGTCLYCALVEEFLLGCQFDGTVGGGQAAAVGQHHAGFHLQVPSSGHCLFVGHGLTGSQSHILAGFHHALVVQVRLGVHGHIAAFGFHIAFVGDAATSGDHGHRRTCCHGLIVDHGLTGSQFHTLATRHGTLVTQVSLGVHGHVPVLGFHIGLVGDAASIGFQVHTLAARHGTLVLQVRLGVHGHVAVFGFHIAFIDDAAASGGHGHSGTCPHDALVEDFIGRRQFHLVGSDQALVDHALGGVQDDVVPGQAVFILQGPGCLFMEPAAANGEGSRSLQISLVIDQADASRSRHRSVDGQVVHRTVLVVANGDILCLAVSVKGNGQVFAAAAADDHIGGIAAVLHGHGLEVVELRVICKSGTTVERNARSRINRNRLCRDGMGRRLLDGATCLEVQRIGSECAVLQVDFPVTGQIHRICLHLTHKRRRFFIVPKAQVGFSRHSNRMARTRFHRAEQEKTVLFPGLALASQVNIAIFRFGIDGCAIPQDAYAAVLCTDAALCLQIK